MALPRPRPAPVTIATLPANLLIVSLFLPYFIHHVAQGDKLRAQAIVEEKRKRGLWVNIGKRGVSFGDLDQLGGLDEASSDETDDRA